MIVKGLGQSLDGGLLFCAGRILLGQQPVAVFPNDKCASWAAQLAEHFVLVCRHRFRQHLPDVPLFNVFQVPSQLRQALVFRFP